MIILQNGLDFVCRDINKAGGFRLLFTEEREGCFLPVRCCVERTGLHVLCQRGVIFAFIFHVVAECDKLEHIEILLVLRFFKPLVQHTIELCLNTAFVIRVLNLKESKRNTVDKNGNVRTERTFLFAFGAFLAKCQLIYNGEVVVFDAVKINQLNSVLRIDQPFIESFSEIVVLDNREDICDDCLNLFIGKRPSVDSLNSRFETVYCDSCFCMKIDILQGLVFVAKAKELNGCRYFNSGIFVKLSHSSHSFPSLCFESKPFPSRNNQCLVRCKRP